MPQLNSVPSLTGRPWLKGLIAALAFWLLASCSAVQVSYNNADIAIRWMVQDYFDLQGPQEAEFRARLARFHAWHRSQELPRYEALARAAAERMADGISGDDIHWASEALHERYRALMHHAIEEAVPILVTLTPAQLAHCEAELANSNRKFAKEFLSGSEEKRLAARIKRLREHFSDWLGSLTPEQEARITAMVEASPAVSAQRMEERKQNQQHFLQLLRAYKKPEDLSAKLQELAENIESRRSPDQAGATREAEPRFQRLLLDLDQTLTAAQRDRAIQRFSRFARDFRILATQGDAAPQRVAMQSPPQ